MGNMSYCEIENINGDIRETIDRYYDNPEEWIATKLTESRELYAMHDLLDNLRDLQDILIELEEAEAEEEEEDEDE